MWSWGGYQCTRNFELASNDVFSFVSSWTDGENGSVINIDLRGGMFENRHRHGYREGWQSEAIFRKNIEKLHMDKNIIIHCQNLS